MEKINTVLCDFAWVILFPQNNYSRNSTQLFNDSSQKQEYCFQNHFCLNAKLLTRLKDLQPNITSHIATASNLDIYPEALDKLKEIFTSFFTTKSIGLSKHDPDFYHEITKKLNKKPNEILFIDDTLINIQAAQKAKLKTLHFTSTDECLNSIQKIL